MKKETGNSLTEFAVFAANNVIILFDRGAPQGGLSCPSGAIHLLYVDENTSQAASVEFVRQR